jgi:hypothetical protein
MPLIDYTQQQIFVCYTARIRWNLYRDVNSTVSVVSIVFCEAKEQMRKLGPGHEPAANTANHRVTQIGPIYYDIHVVKT